MMAASISIHTGAPIADDAELRQSIATILSTPIGTRVMRRSFGSLLFQLVDSAGNGVGRLRLIAATADALERWEPRITMLSASLAVNGDGLATLRVDCAVKLTGTRLTADVTLGRGTP